MADDTNGNEMSIELGGMESIRAGQHAIGDKFVTNGENSPNAIIGRPPVPGGSGGTASSPPSASTGTGGGSNNTNQ